MPHHVLFCDDSIGDEALRAEIAREEADHPDPDAEPLVLYGTVADTLRRAENQLTLIATRGEAVAAIVVDEFLRGVNPAQPEPAAFRLADKVAALPFKATRPKLVLACSRFDPLRAHAFVEDRGGDHVADKLLGWQHVLGVVRRAIAGERWSMPRNPAFRPTANDLAVLPHLHAEDDPATIAGRLGVSPRNVNDWIARLHERLEQAGLVSFPNVESRRVALAQAAIDAGVLWVPPDLERR